MPATATSRHGLLTAKMVPYLSEEGSVRIRMDVTDSTLGLAITDRRMFIRWDVLDFGDGTSDYQVQDFYDYSEICCTYQTPTDQPVYIKYRLTWSDEYVSETTSGPHYMFPSRVKN